MFVVHVVRQYPPRLGGLEDAVSSLAACQRAAGLRVRVVTLDTLFNAPGRRLPAREIIGGVEIVRIPWAGSSRYPLAPAVLGHIRGADLVHVHAIDFFFDYLAATRWLRRIPMVVSTHGGFFHSDRQTRLKHLWMRTVTRMSCRAYRRVIACSDADAQMFREAAGARLVTIENGISPGKLSRAASSDPVRVLISFGRFAAHKRIFETLGLLFSLRALDLRWRLILAGAPDDLSVAEIEAEAARIGMSDAVRVVPSPDDAALRGLVGEASFFVSMSSHEGFGIAAVEALSAGLVPVFSRIAPFLNLLRAGAPGIAVDPEAPAGAARGVVRLFETMEADGGQVMREQAMAVAAGYDWAAVSARYVTLYQHVVAGNGRR